MNTKGSKRSIISNFYIISYCIGSNWDACSIGHNNYYRFTPCLLICTYAVLRSLCALCIFRSNCLLKFLDHIAVAQNKSKKLKKKKKKNKAENYFSSKYILKYTRFHSEKSLLIYHFYHYPHFNKHSFFLRDKIWLLHNPEDTVLIPNNLTLSLRSIPPHKVDGWQQNNSKF